MLIVDKVQKVNSVLISFSKKSQPVLLYEETNIESYKLKQKPSLKRTVKILEKAQ